MTWAKVCDTLHSHPKVLDAGLEAMGLWLRALSRVTPSDISEAPTRCPVYSPLASAGPPSLAASAPASSGTQHCETTQPSTRAETLCAPLTHDSVQTLGAQASAPASALASVDASPSSTP